MGSVERPVTPFVLSLLGGLLILVFSLISLATLGRAGSGGGAGAVVALFQLTGMVSGVVVVVSAVMLYSRPQDRAIWGILTVVFSALSLFGVFGSFGFGGLIGLILGVVGGAVGIAWKPTGSTLASGMPPLRACLNCGRLLPTDARFCSSCGKEVLSSSQP